MARHRSKAWLAGVFVTASALLTSCTSRPARLPPPIPLPDTFSVGGSSPLPGKWWTAFRDEQLNALIEQALGNNFSLLMAWDRLDQASAVAAKSGADRWPNIDGSAASSRSVIRTAGSDSSEAPAAGATRQYATDHTLALATSYELDLWGRVRGTHGAAELDVRATEEDVRAAAITLSAEIARTWYQLAERRAQLRLVRAQTRTNEEYLEIITHKFRHGRASATDVLQQRQLVEERRGERVLVEGSIQVLEHQLAVLLGQTPGRLDVHVLGVLPELPPLPETGLPSEWVRRRPDVRAAELRVQAADRRIAAAIADRFPRLTLSLSAETSAEEIRDLFDNWLAGLAANLTAPLLDGGRRRAEVRRTRAARAEQLHSYAQVVLTSLKEVEDALVEEAKHAEYVRSLRRQLRLSRQATAQTRENYIKGGTDFTRYLTTLLSHQRLERTGLEAQRRLVEFRISLYRALGGSWDLSRPSRSHL